MSLLEAPPRVDPDSMSRQEYLKASPPMFGPAWMDRLTRVHVAVVPAIFVPAILVFAVLALREIAWWETLLLIGAGYVVWTLTEYWLHRLVFHFEPDHPVGARLHWMIHGVHHDHPNDPLRLVMPPSASLPLAAIFALLFQALLPFAQACALSAGFFAGYLAYDMLHYYVHHRRPKGPIGRRLRELHMRHHFQDHDRGYGVSAPWWDRVFGTAPIDRREP
ncbi:MAG: sterol desaturase family protein [Solirubrobacteraceae bacterium]|nr:sterol desaturase family protein [Solirubrobacteraceae bacterium]